MTIAIIFIGLVLLVFCIVDLWHLKEFLKEMKSSNILLKRLVEKEYKR